MNDSDWTRFTLSYEEMIKIVSRRAKKDREFKKAFLLNPLEVLEDEFIPLSATDRDRLSAMKAEELERELENTMLARNDIPEEDFKGARNSSKFSIISFFMVFIIFILFLVFWK